MLASGDEASNSSLNRSLNIVQNVQQEVESNIDKALAPFLGMDNFRSSVTADLNTDAQQEIQETVYDPESKVERSVRATKEASQSQQKQSDSATTVEQNASRRPPPSKVAAIVRNRRTSRTRRKSRQTTRSTARRRPRLCNSYEIEKLSIAVVVNKGRIAQMVGEPADQAKIDCSPRRDAEDRLVGSRYQC
ncbi:flagellar M-ring protein FliF C-terminal domain-containing protein [Rhizobium yanglingense]